MKKRMLVVALILLVVLALCACGGQENTDDLDTEVPGMTLEDSSTDIPIAGTENVESNMTGTTEAKITPVDDFEYEMVDGEVIITGYRGVDREIYIPAEINDRPVTQIGEQAFYRYDLVYIEIPDSVVLIDENAFASCKCLEEVRLPDSYLRIELGAFYECDALEKVELPKNLEFLGYGAFGYCDNLKQVRLPDNFNGFDITYQEWIEWYDNGGYSIENGEKINSPVHGDSTILVVKWESEAHKLIRDYGYVGYIADYSAPENDYVAETIKHWVLESQIMLDSTGNEIQTIDYQYNDRGVLLRTEANFYGEVTITEYMLDTNGHPNKAVYMENGEIVGESVVGCDTQGNIVREEYIRNGIVVQAVQYSYDDQGALQKRVTESYNDDGTVRYTLTSEYDKDGRIVHQNTDREDGYSRYEYQYQYDEKGYPCMRVCLMENSDEDGVRVSESYERIICDDSGHMVFMAGVDENGWDLDSYQIYEYDRYGNMVKSISYRNGEINLTVIYTYVELK